jgi:hypothetical protein
LGLDCAASGRPPSVTDHSSQLQQLGELSRSLRLAKSTTEGYPVCDDDVVRLSPYMRRHLSVHGTALLCCPTSPVPTARCGTQTPTTATVPLLRKPDAGRLRLAGHVLVTVEDDLCAERRMPLILIVTAPASWP